MRCEHTKEKKLAFVSFLKKMKKKKHQKESKKEKEEREREKRRKAESKKRVAKNLRSHIIRRCVFQSNENE
jgi:hypothetical protein